MDHPEQKSCWGITVKALIGLAGILALAWLIGGADTTAMLAAS